MVEQACTGLLLDPGLGKTSISLGTAKIFVTKNLMKGMLIIAPLRVIYDVWPEEIKKWKDFNSLTYTLIHDKAKWKNLWGPQKNIYLINPEAVPELVKQLLARPKNEWPFDVLLVDESTKFKNGTSKRFKALRHLVNSFRRRYILTGTPTPNGLIDLFGQIYILDQGASLGRFITHYRNKYFYSTGYGGYTWEPREGAYEEVADAIAPLVIRMRAEDYIKMPAIQYTYDWMELPAPARNTYRELEEQFLTEVEDDVVIAPSAAVAGMKCRQVLNGALYINAAHDWKLIHDAKMDAMKDLVEELSGQPLLVFYEFNHDRERLMKDLGFPCIGHQSAKLDSLIIKKFNAGILPGLVAHPATAGHGLNLQGNCAHVCWFGLTWNLEHYDQALRRVWRQGNNAPKVIVHHLCIRDSLDESVVGTLKAKDKNQTTLMEHIRRRK